MYILMLLKNIYLIYEHTIIKFKSSSDTVL